MNSNPNENHTESQETQPRVGSDPLMDDSNEQVFVEQDVKASAHDFPKIISFEKLSRCGDEIWIENEGQIYRLRKTRQGKLILTK